MDRRGEEDSGVDTLGMVDSTAGTEVLEKREAKGNLGFRPKQLNDRK